MPFKMSFVLPLLGVALSTSLSKLLTSSATNNAYGIMTEKHRLKIASSSDAELIVEFGNAADRWSNRWILINGDVETEIMTSVEGTPEQDWPSSPPLQDISAHELPTGNAILGVGMAGKSHWSASVVAAAETDDCQVIRCEWACLRKDETELRNPKAQLSSVFALCNGVVMNRIADGGVELVSSESSLNIAIEPVVGEKWSSKFECNGNQLSIQPTVYSDSPVRSTQWGMSARLSG